MKQIAKQIINWSQTNPWFDVSFESNQLRLERALQDTIEQTLQALDYHNNPRLKNHLSISYERLRSVCQQIDLFIRSSCRDKKDSLDLLIMRCDARTKAFRLADIFLILDEITGNGNTELPVEKDMPDDEWIKFSEASETLGLSISTISNWANQGKLKDNGKKGRNRRLSKISVLMMERKMKEEQGII